MIEQALKENENKEKFIDFSKNANEYNLSHVKWFFLLKSLDDVSQTLKIRFILSLNLIT